jgi:hypothetical protein
MSAITSMDALKESLVSSGIELSRWGIGDAKTIENLWAEIRTGEIQLQSDPLVRVLEGVVQVIITRDDGHILIEDSQVFIDGRRRLRNIPPAEKMLPGETVVETARRCLVEELHFRPDEIDILENTHTCFNESRTSWSYPGLLSQYTIHRVEARVHGLPARNFTTTEYDNPGEDTVEKHYWVWKDPSCLD